MIRSTRGAVAPRRVLIAVAATLVPLIAGCEAGTNAPTLHWHQPTNGTFARVGRNITVSNAFVLGAPIGAAIKQGQNAGLFLTLVNTGSPDRLVGIAAPGVAQSVRLPAGGVSVRHQILLTGPQPAVLLQNLLRPLAGGSVIKITLVFARAGAKTIFVPVMPMASEYNTFSPAPAPTSASPSPSATGHGAGTSGSPTPSPAGSP